MRPLNYRIKIAIILVLLLAFFLSLNFTPLGREVKNFFYLASSPIQKVLWSAGQGLAGFFGAMADIQGLKQENQELRREIQELKVEIVALKELKKENIFLREALEIGLQEEFQLILAEVIGKDTHQDFILINQGTKDGISEGQPVITQQKVLVGRISQVYKNFSKVLLISNPQSSFDGKTSDSEILGVVRGRGNLRVFFDLILKEEEIREGDLVVTGALGGIFPLGLLIGEISRVERVDPEPFQTATIEPAFNIRDLEKLFVIIKW